MIQTYREAIREGFHEVMTKDPSVFMIGVGLSDPNACFGTLRGFYEEFGPKRVIEAPLAEAMLTGLVLGAALMGMKPILVHQRINFAFLGMDQLINHICLYNDTYSTKQALPIMIRGVAGEEGWGNGAQHVGSFYDLFATLKDFSDISVFHPDDGIKAKEYILQWHLRGCTAIYTDRKELYDQHYDTEKRRFFPDPLPEVTAHERFPNQKPKPNISLHGAWKLGYESGKGTIS